MFARKLFAGVQLVAYLAMVSVFAPRHAAEHAAEYASAGMNRGVMTPVVVAGVSRAEPLAAEHVTAKQRHTCGHHHHHACQTTAIPATSGSHSVPVEKLPVNPFEHEQDCAQCQAVSQKTLAVTVAVDVTIVTLLSHELNQEALEAPASGSVQLPLSRGPPA